MLARSWFRAALTRVSVLQRQSRADECRIAVGSTALGQAQLRSGKAPDLSRGSAVVAPGPAAIARVGVGHVCSGSGVVSTVLGRNNIALQAPPKLAIIQTYLQPLWRSGIVQRQLLSGGNAARSDDTRSVKIAIIEWLSDSLKHAKVVLHPTDKTQRGFNNPVTGRLLCPIVLDYADDSVRRLLETHQATIDGHPVNGSHWPIFAFDEHRYNPAMPWESFLRGRLIVQGFRHIFTSPSSAVADDDGHRGTRTGNAAIHGMTKVTPGSIIYSATQVHFALSSATVFNKNNKKNDTIIFYRSLLDFFEDPRLAAPVADLLEWWNCTVFPTYYQGPQTTAVNHGLQQMHAALQALASQGQDIATLPLA
ncbi:hypothetical protein OH77DRAFT_1509078 [Trametes cingulata]|nr:hypothetical protein OH77DRAFT_1509078 [Trametes cingulata]